MLLANMAKHDSMQRALELKRDVPKDLSVSKWAMDQLLDCFVKGAEGGYNKNADFNYLSYFFADLGKVSYPICSNLGLPRLTRASVPERPRIPHLPTRARFKHHPFDQIASLYLTPLSHPPTRGSVCDQERCIQHKITSHTSFEPIAGPEPSSTVDRREPPAISPSSAYGTRGIRRRRYRGHA